MNIRSRANFRNSLLLIALSISSFAAHALCALTPSNSVLALGQTTKLRLECDTAPIAASSPTPVTLQWQQRFSASQTGQNVTTIEIGPQAAFSADLNPPATANPLLSLPPSYEYEVPSTLPAGTHYYQVKMTGSSGGTDGVYGPVRVVVLAYNVNIQINKSNNNWGSIEQIGTPSRSINCPPTQPCSPETIAMPQGETLNLKAIPAAGYGFLGWSGDCTGTLICSLTPQTNKRVIANFGQQGQCTIQATDARVDINAGACVGTLSNVASTISQHTWACQGDIGSPIACSAKRAYHVLVYFNASAGGQITDGSNPISTATAFAVPYGGTQAFTLAPPAPVNGVAKTLVADTGNECQFNVTNNTLTVLSVNQSCALKVKYTEVVNGLCAGTVPALTDVAPTSSTQNLCATPFPGTITSTPSTDGTNWQWTCPKVATAGQDALCTSPRGHKVYFSTETAGANIQVTGNVAATSPILVRHNSTASFTITAPTTPAGLTPSFSGTTTPLAPVCPGLQSPSGSQVQTSAITAACGAKLTYAAATSPPTDPGFGSNLLWLPPGTTDIVVADHSAPGSPVYIPGCLNGGSASNVANGCAIAASYSAVPAGLTSSYSVALGSSKTLALRFRPLATAGATLKNIGLASGDGGNVGSSPKFWIGNTATETYEQVQAARPSCVGVLGDFRPRINTGPGACPITYPAPNDANIYYVNVRVDQGCTSCRLVVTTDNMDFE